VPFQITNHKHIRKEVELIPPAIENYFEPVILSKSVIDVDNEIYGHPEASN